MFLSYSRPFFLRMEFIPNYDLLIKANCAVFLNQKSQPLLANSCGRAEVVGIPSAECEAWVDDETLSEPREN